MKLKNNNNQQKIADQKKLSGFCILFIILGILSILGGIIGAIILWPHLSVLEDKKTTYIPSISILASGVAFALFFWAFSWIIKRISHIKHSLFLYSL